MTEYDEHVREWNILRREWLIYTACMPWDDFVQMMFNDKYQVWLGV